MMIQFSCSQCGKSFKVADEWAGKQAKCKACGGAIQIPALEPEQKDKESDVLDVFVEAAVNESSKPTASQAAQTPLRPPVSVEANPAPLRPPVMPSVPLESGHVIYAPSINVHTPKRSSSLGIVSLIIGVLAFMFCWIPILGIISIPLSALGLLLAAIGLIVAIVRRGAGVGWPVGGGVICGLALLIGFSQIAVIGATAEAVTEVKQAETRTVQEVVGGPTDKTSDQEQIQATAPPQPKNQEQEWASAKDTVKQGDIQLRITKVLTGKVPLKTIMQSTSTSDEPLLAIHVELTNVSQNKKVQYRSWIGTASSIIGNNVSLKDNFDNIYRKVDFGFSAQPEGHTEGDSIYPGKALSDVLVFELPIDTIQHLDLELPGDNFGGQGMLRLRIPVNMVQARK